MKVFQLERSLRTKAGLEIRDITEEVRAIRDSKQEIAAPVIGKERNHANP